MNLCRLILDELKFRKLNFILGLISIAVAIGFLVGSLVLLRLDKHQTTLLLAQQQEAVTKASAWVKLIPDDDS